MVIYPGSSPNSLTFPYFGLIKITNSQCAWVSLEMVGYLSLTFQENEVPFL